MSKKPKVLYSNSINLSGLYSKTPIKCTDEGDGQYYDNRGYYSIHFTPVGRVIQFTSESEREVQVWTDGVLSAMKLMKQWCGGRE